MVLKEPEWSYKDPHKYYRTNNQLCIITKKKLYIKAKYKQL